MTDLAPGLERVFAIEPREGVFPLGKVAGRLPWDLRGTYYVNGPGRFRRGELSYRHWLDGDGLISALVFGEDGAVLTTRFVRSAKLRDEDAAGRALYRTFGTSFPGDQLVRGIGLATPVNVSAYRFNGALLAFGEQGLPWALDPWTLETQGVADFGCLSPITPFSAHPHFDPDSGEMVAFGISYSADRPAIHLYRLHPDVGLVARRRVALDLPRSIHDFSLSPRRAVFYLSPYVLDMAALLGGSTVQGALSWQPEHGSRLLVVDREGDEADVSIPLPGPTYCLHQINAFEDGEHLVVDVLELPEPVYPQYQELPDLFTDVPPAQPVRLVADLTAGRLVERVALPYDLAADFPSIDPRRGTRSYQRFWMLAISKTGRGGRKFFDRLVAVDWQQGGVAGTWTAPAGCYLGGEPVLAGHPDREEHGVLICQCFDSEREASSFLLFDAEDIAAGPCAELPLPAPLPPGFHASFVTAAEERRL